MTQPPRSGFHKDRARKYGAHGLTILSDMQFPELTELEDSEQPQVRIVHERVAAKLEDPVSEGGLFQVATGQFLLRIGGVARYLASNGTEIRVDPFPGADDNSVRLFLLESVLGALMHQRGIFPLHASAIETSRGAVLFAGPSSTGKSALAAAFLARGYRVIADEICAIALTANGVEVAPSFPRLLLWPDIIEELGLWGANVRPVRPNLERYHVPIAEKEFATRPSPIHAIYTLGLTTSSVCDLSPLSGFEKIQALIRLSFRRSFLPGMCSGKEHFRSVTALAVSARVSRLRRPDVGPVLKETADLLEADFLG